MGIGRVIVTGAIVATGLGVLSACGWNRETLTESADLNEEFSRVQFTNDSGNITITTGAQPSVKREIHYADEPPGPTYRVEGDTLILESCPTRNCSIDYTVVVPEGTTVDGELHSGNAELADLAGVNLRSDSGNVTLSDIDGGVNLDIDSGNADLSGIRGAAQVQADSGDVSIALAVQQDVRAQVSSGNVEVTVPEGAYRVTTDVDSGHVDSDLTDDATADHHLDLSADSGNITVSTT